MEWTERRGNNSKECTATGGKTGYRDRTPQAIAQSCISKLGKYTLKSKQKLHWTPESTSPISSGMKMYIERLQKR